MTDEEKAVEYVLNTYYAKYVTEEEKIFLCDEIKFNDRMKINAYLAGLEEGRRDSIKAYLAGIEGGRKELKKENAELKKQLEKTNEDCAKEILDAMGIVSQRNLKIEQLEKENDELKHEIDELKQQIEELTCSKKYYCRLSDGTTVPCFMTKLCSVCQYKDLAE